LIYILASSRNAEFINVSTHDNNSELIIAMVCSLAFIGVIWAPIQLSLTLARDLPKTYMREMIVYLLYAICTKGKGSLC